MTDAARGPALLVGIDTEADDQWSEKGRRELRVQNADRLPALQSLFDGFGVRPTYLVTHEMAFAHEVAHRVVFMDAGQIQAAGTPAEIFEEARNERLQSFLSRFVAFHRRRHTAAGTRPGSPDPSND